MKRLVIIICAFLVLLLGSPTTTEGQDGGSQSNPFDLLYRLDDDARKAALTPATNPFDISSPAEALKKQQEEEAKYQTDFLIEISRYEGDQAVPRNWLLFVIVPLILFLTVVSSLFRDKISTIYKACTNGNYLSLSYRESMGRTNFHTFFFYILSILSFAAFGLILAVNEFINNENFWQAMMVAIGLSTAYILSKSFGIAFVRSVFPNKKTMDYYLFMFGQYNFLLGLVLIPFSIFIAFSPGTAQQIITYIALIIIGIWWIMRIFRGLQIGSRFLSGNIFRFFIYLCTVEIAPIIILFTILKLILNV